MTINCNQQLIDISIPKVMGILNCTPDSFFDGGKHNNETLILEQVEKMVLEGTEFIDIGAYSTRPNAAFVSEQEETARIVPVVKAVVKNFPKTFYSIDTFRSEVAKKCLDEGASMINDITAGVADDKMLETVAKYKVPFVMMHTRGTPQNMQEQTKYDNIITEMIYYFSQRVAQARTYGISDIIIDPGFGFAKTVEQNFEVLGKLELFKTLNLPILVGISRKSMIYKTLETSATEALNGTTVLNTISVIKGANILRVHDVKEATECVKLLEKLKQQPDCTGINK